MGKFDIDKLKKKTLIKYPFFGSIIASTELIESTKVSTVGTDGNKIIYNPNYMSSLRKEEQIFVFAHEIGHIALNHVKRSKNKDKKTWNIATDAVINAFLQSDGLKMPADGVDMPEAINYDAEELYKKLMEQKQNGNQGNSRNQNEGSNPNQSNEQNNSSSLGENKEQTSNDNGSSSDVTESNEDSSTNNENNSKGSENVGHDDHDFWNDDVTIDDYKEDNDKQAEEKTEQKNKNIIDKLKKRFNKNKEETKEKENQNDKTNDKRNKDIEKISEMGEKEAFSQNEKQKQEQLKKLLDSISKEATSAGKQAGNNSMKLEDIGTAKSLMDWRMVLREAVNHEVDWSYRNSEIEDGVLKTYLEDIPMPETEIVLDTSGSIDDELLRCFLRECKNILKDSKIKAGCFDTRFYGFQEIRTEGDIDNMKFLGRGGTDFDAAVNAFSRRVENKIIFTDGEASMPNKTVDAIWVVFGSQEINPPGGRVIYVNEQKLREIYSFESTSIKTR